MNKIWGAISPSNAEILAKTRPSNGSAIYRTIAETLAKTQTKMGVMRHKRQMSPWWRVAEVLSQNPSLDGELTLATGVIRTESFSIELCQVRVDERRLLLVVLHQVLFTDEAVSVFLQLAEGQPAIIPLVSRSDLELERTRRLPSTVPGRNSASTPFWYVAADGC
ncbi:hypothetical protein CBL_10779 [Carabus blaptoides fortunei]